MNAIAKLALQHTVSAVVGAGAATAATVAVVSSGAHETLTLAIGDTITPRFSVRTDSVLKAPGGGLIVVTACGASNIYLRNYQRQTQRTADTVDVTVPCAPASVASVDVCFLNPDSATKYGISGDTSVDPKNFPPTLKCDSTADLSVAAFRRREFEARHPRIASTMLQPSPTIAAPVVDPDPWAASRVSGANARRQ